MAPSAISMASQLYSRSSVPKANMPPGLKLVSAGRLDLRSDEEISEWLQRCHPVTSNKNVWAYWHTGFAKMAPWVQRNIINWVRRLGPEWTVHLLDNVPGSETNVHHFVEPSYFPDSFNENTMDGPFMGQHSGDMVRLPLLLLYGGVWMDAGTFLFRHLDDICWKQIEDKSSPYELAGFQINLRPNEDCMLNGFIAAKRNNPFIRRWHDIYLEVWKGARNSHGLHKHPLLRHLPLLCPPTDQMNCPDLNLLMESFSDYFTHFLAYDRLRKLVDPNDGSNGPDYFAKHMLLLPAIQETYYFQQMTGWSGSRQFELLTARRDGEGVVQDEKWHAAESFVNDALANTSTMKLSHGPAGALESFLADLWDSEEHQDKDNVDGTFAAYLRYGSGE